MRSMARMMTRGLAFCVLLISGMTPGLQDARGEASKGRPNILFCISDDQSWLHASAYGDKVVKTPHFDRIAREGVLFTHAFSASPSCTPSRSAVLTGKPIWQLGHGGILSGVLHARFKTYVDILEEAGYVVGFTGKGWMPGNWRAGGRSRNPAGKKYDKRRIKLRELPAFYLSGCDYAGNFEDFLNDRPKDKPFCFWYGGHEPHRKYEGGIGLELGKAVKDVAVPPFLPDIPLTRSDILDYYVEIEWFDTHLGRMIQLLESLGELENTMIVVTSDNGMPFPRGKATLYDYGIRMPLAIRWGARVNGGRVVNDLVSLIDVAPTLLEAAGVNVPGNMAGRSLMNILLSDKSGRVDADRTRVFAALERHAWARLDGLAYPMRAIRTDHWLYIRNYEPDRWPAGEPGYDSRYAGVYGEIDHSPTKYYMMQCKDDPDMANLFQLGFGKRPAEELYDVQEDPCQLKNLAGESAFASTVATLRGQLEAYLRETNDPRLNGKTPWDHYPDGGLRWPGKTR